MRKCLSEYRAIIVDMDGTLYFQAPVRFLMAVTLVAYYIFNPLKIKELQVLLHYRTIRESRSYSDRENFTSLQINELHERFGLPVKHIISIISYWMQEYPLKFVRLFRDRKLVSLLNRAKRLGTTIIVYSDYPTQEKVIAVGLDADFQFFSGDGIISCMKPAPKGLIKILELTKVPPQKVLFIGDRYSRDGLCAKAVGVDYMILSKYWIARRALYQSEKMILHGAPK